MTASAPRIEDHLAALPAELDARQNAVAPAVKEYLGAHRGFLESLHRESRSGRRVNEANSDLTDRMVRRLYELAEELHLARGGALPSGVAVIAVGGYARREMSIHSDVDLLLLYRDELTPFVEFLAERLQYWLWDAGLHIGMATRTIADTVEMGREDVTVRTAVLTARFLCGDGEFFHDFADRIRDELLPDPVAFVSEQLELMRERQLEYGDTLYLLQPNVKEGAGTLRDYHAAYWVARGTQPSVRNVDDLLHFGLLTETEMDEYREARWEAVVELLEPAHERGQLAEDGTIYMVLKIAGEDPLAVECDRRRVDRSAGIQCSAPAFTGHRDGKKATGVGPVAELLFLVPAPTSNAPRAHQGTGV